MSILLYADDIVLIADSPEQLQQMLDHTTQYARRWHFRFNTKAGKSDVVAVGCSKKRLQELRKVQFRLGEGVLRLSSEYKYLGVELGKVGKGSWSSYFGRIKAKAVVAANELAYSVSGRSPLQLETVVHLFNTLVRSKLEYAGAVWAPSCSDTWFKGFDGVQAAFGRKVLRLSHKVAGEFVRRELGMASIKERVVSAMLRYYGRLIAMPDSRLAGFIFRRRCEEVDLARGGKDKKNWCTKVKRWLTDLGCQAYWRAAAVPSYWPSFVTVRVQRHLEADAELRLLAKSSLETFRELGRQPLQWWRQDEALRHPGAMVRSKLRAGAAPLMMAVGPRHHIPRDDRTCRICQSGQLETAEHLVSHCPEYAAERGECMARLRGVLLPHSTPMLQHALDTAAVGLILGDLMVRHLPADVARRTDAIICGFLHAVWAKRSPLWLKFCQDGNEWRLID